jgi:hypothetical protein
VGSRAPARPPSPARTQTIVNQTSLGQPLGPVGYALAGEQLRLGTDVVAECVNPLTITRDAWLRTAESSAAVLVDIEVICSDPESIGSESRPGRLTSRG